MVCLLETEGGDNVGNENRVELHEDGQGEDDRIVVDGGVDGAVDLWVERMRGATIPDGIGKKSGVEEAMAADADEGW